MQRLRLGHQARRRQLVAALPCSLGCIAEEARDVAGAVEKAHDFDAPWLRSVEDQVVLEATDDPRAQPIGSRRTELARATCSRLRQEHADRALDGVQKALRRRWRFAADVGIGVGEVFLCATAPRDASAHGRHPRRTVRERDPVRQVRADDCKGPGSTAMTLAAFHSRGPFFTDGELLSLLPLAELRLERGPEVLPVRGRHLACG